MANITILNTSSNLSSKTLLAAENSNTITGLLTFDRDPSAPFAVTASSANVPNLDADKLDGLDSTAFPLLSAVNAFTAAGVHTWTGTVNGTHAIRVTNSSNGGTASARFDLGNDIGTQGLVQLTSSGNSAEFGVKAVNLRALSGATTGVNITAEDAAGIISFYTGGPNLRWQINAAGAILFGGSGHLAISNATPTISSGFGAGSTITGAVYAFRVTCGGGTSTGTVAFNTTFNTAPSVVAISANKTLTCTTTTTTVQINTQDATNFPGGEVIQVHVLGF